MPGDGGVSSTQTPERSGGPASVQKKLEMTASQGAEAGSTPQQIETFWQLFFSTFASSAETDHVNSACSFLSGAKVKSLVELAENTMEDLESCSDWPEGLRPKALLRKTHKHAVELHGAAQGGSLSFSQSVASAPSRQRSAVEEAEEQEFIRLVGGSTANALTVSRVLRRRHSIDIKSLLLSAGLSKLGFFHSPGDALFQFLFNCKQEHEAECAAENKHTICFPYVDITRNDVVAPWMNVEAIGGSSDAIGSCTLDPLGGTECITKMGKALTQLTERRRFFRNFQQWLVAFLRYAMAMLAVELMSLDLAMLHLFVIVRLIDDERKWGHDVMPSAPTSTYLAILYDELHRQNIAKRADRGDPAPYQAPPGLSSPPRYAGVFHSTTPRRRD